MIEALGWGALAASSLLVGALIGLARTWPGKAIGLVLGFGAGALISAVSFELAQEGVEVGGNEPVAAGLAVGALTYFVAAGLVGSAGGDSPALRWPSALSSTASPSSWCWESPSPPAGK